MQAIFLALHFLTIKKPHLMGNKILGLLLLSFAISSFSQQIILDIPVLSPPFIKNLYIVHLLLSLAMYLFLFFYIQTVNKEKIGRKHISFHLTIIIVYFSFCQIIVGQIPVSSQNNIKIYTIVSLVNVLLYSFYLISSLVKLRKWNNMLSSQKKINLSFPLILTGGVILLWLRECIVLSLTMLDIIKDALTFIAIIFIAPPFIFIHAILLMALKNPEFFYINQNHSAWFMKEEEQSNYLNGFIKLMEKEKVYKDSELTLNKIASRLQINPKYLSLILNKQLHCSFPHIINKYRIETSKELLENESGMTIQQIMYEVGYNSKSAFNNHFKRFTGYTPSEYKIKYSK
jgi:AraC-like DNA-binding protein